MENEVRWCNEGIGIENERKLGMVFGGGINVDAAGNGERMNESSAANSEAKST